MIYISISYFKISKRIMIDDKMLSIQMYLLKIILLVIFIFKKNAVITISSSPK